MINPARTLRLHQAPELGGPLVHPIRTDVTFVPIDVHSALELGSAVTEGTKPSLSANISDLHRDQVLAAVCRKINELCRQPDDELHVCALYTYIPRLCETIVHAVVAYRPACIGSKEEFERFLITAHDIVSPARRTSVVRARTQC